MSLLCWSEASLCLGCASRDPTKRPSMCNLQIPAIRNYVYQEDIDRNRYDSPSLQYLSHLLCSSLPLLSTLSRWPGPPAAPADLNLRSSPWIKRQVYNNGNPYRNADPLPRFISFKERLLTGWGFLSGLSLFRSRTQRRGTWSHTGSGTHTATAQRIAFAFRSSLPLKLSLLEGFGLEDSGKA